MWITTVIELRAKIRSWRTRRQAINELAALDDRTLNDIGLHRSQIPRLVDGQLAAAAARPAGPDAIAVPSGRGPSSSKNWIESCNA